VAIQLSVNLNKVALLRNSRGAHNPGVRAAGETCLASGAYGLTLHWRHDNRHTRADDVREMAALCRDRGAEFNLEGDTRSELVELALAIGVSQFTLVPVTPGEITSDHGWNLPTDHHIIAPVIARLKAAGIRAAIFVDPNPHQMAAAAAAGADRVEIYTEPYASAWGTPRFATELGRVQQTAQAAVAHGLQVNCGHDLNLVNLPHLAREVPELSEASIGHALVADALYLGLEETVRRYVRACRGEDVAAPVTQ